MNQHESTPAQVAPGEAERTASRPELGGDPGSSLCHGASSSCAIYQATFTEQLFTKAEMPTVAYYIQVLGFGKEVYYGVLTPAAGKSSDD